jgi:hypothetical protein
MDAINPQHYIGANGTQLVEVLKEFLTKEEYIGWCKGSIVSYLLRANRKNGEEDYRKAQKICEFLVEK